MAEPRDDWLPYEQQPDESSRHFEYFRLYRDLGPLRTLRRAAEQGGVDYTYLRGLSANEGWLARARAWDIEMDRARRAGLLERQRSVLERHRELAAAMREKAHAALVNTTELDPDDVVRWVRTATQIEMAVFNLPDEPAGAADKTPCDVYFSGLSDLKMLRLSREAINVLEKEVHCADPESSSNRFAAAPNRPTD